MLISLALLITIEETLKNSCWITQF